MQSPTATTVRTPLPRGRHARDRAFVIANQRDRILDAIANEVSEKGYPEVTVTDVIARAGVSSRTFYDLFRDKSECFLAAYDAAIGNLLKHIRAVYEAMPEPSPERAREVLGAVLEVFAATPAFARMCVVDAAAAGPEAVQRFVGMVDSFVPLLDPIDNYEATKRHQGSHLPDPVTRQAIVGGISWIIYRQVVAGETARLPELLPQLTYFLLAPFVGEQEAAAIANADQPATAKTAFDSDGDHATANGSGSDRDT